MAGRRIYDREQHAQFVTFSCYHRRRLLDTASVRDALVEILTQKLAGHDGRCSGYVVMPDHVHLVVWFHTPGALSAFMKSWKQSSSILLKRVLRGVAPRYAGKVPITDPFWQRRYYAFNLYTEAKAREKLDYMHLNPVRAGLVEKAIDWRWSSARACLLNEASPVPLEWVL